MSGSHGHGGDPNDPERRITYFAATHTRGKREMFGIRAIDRGKHMYVIGKTGMGKSTLLENMAIQDIQNGEGIAFIDPHGSTAEKLLDFIPHERIQDVVYFAPFDTDHPVGFNVMEDVGFDKRHLVVSGLIGAFKRIWVDAWSARMEYILQNTLLALLEYPGSTILDVNKMLTNKIFRNAVVEKVTDPIVRAFWTEEFASFTDTYTREATPAIQNKVGAFVSNPLIRNIVGQPTSSFDLRKLMDEKKIFIVNLSKGRMGESNAALLGSMLTVKIYLAAMSRADEPASVLARLPRCYFYVDEFQSMMNEAFADILSESRKYKLALTLANQYIEQMEEEVRDAVFGNVGTLICFRVGPFDAEVLTTVFEPTFEAEDLVGLGLGQIYLTLMIDGVGSPPFSAQTIPPIEQPRISYREDVINQSRAMYGRPRADVEAAINKKQADFAVAPKKASGSKPEGGPRREGGYQGGDRQGRPEHGHENRPVRSPVQILHSPQPAPSGFATARSHEPRFIVGHEQPGGGMRTETADPRNSLRAAIEAAKTVSAPEPPPVSAAPPRSPLEIMRAKMAAKGAPKQTSASVPPAPPPPVTKIPVPPSTRDMPPQPHKNQHSAPPEPLMHRPPQEAPRRPQEPRHQGQHQPQAQQSQREQTHNGGEISKEMLERVLRGNDHSN